MKGATYVDSIKTLHRQKIAFYDAVTDVALHDHDYIELVYFYSNQGYHIINDEKFHICNGHICIMNASIKHSYKTILSNNKEIAVKNIMFMPSFLDDKYSKENFLDEIYTDLMGHNPKTSLSYIQTDSDYNKDYLNLICMIEGELTRKGENSLQIAQQCLKAILYKLFRDNTSFKKKTAIALSNTRTIEDSIRYLSENYNKNITLYEMAEKYYFSDIYFNQLFRNYSGLTFKKYMQKLRCEKAKEFLKTTDDSVETICGKVGYSDIKQFYMIFKRIVGLTPSQYRNDLEV